MMATCFIANLPDLVLVNVFHWLDVKNRLLAVTVCKRWLSLISLSDFTRLVWDRHDKDMVARFCTMIRLNGASIEHVDFGASKPTAEMLELVREKCPNLK